MTLYVPLLDKAGERGHYVNCSRRDVNLTLCVNVLFLWLRKGACTFMEGKGFLNDLGMGDCEMSVHVCVCMCVHVQMDNRSLCLGTTRCSGLREWEGHLQGLNVLMLSPGCLGEVLPEGASLRGKDGQQILSQHHKQGSASCWTEREASARPCAHTLNVLES